MDDTTARLDLPLIAPGQAGKEITHNEALSRLAILVQPIVMTVGVTTPPPDPLPGQAWIVGAAAEGIWAGHDLAIAGWTDGGWRFVSPEEGMTAWVVADQLAARFLEGDWRIGELRGRQLFIDGSASIGAPQPAIADPVGGTNIDLESRSSIAGILDALRYHGLVERGG